jgi:hypothetical protein
MFTKATDITFSHHFEKHNAQHYDASLSKRHTLKISRIVLALANLGSMKQIESPKIAKSSRGGIISACNCTM